MAGEQIALFLILALSHIVSSNFHVQTNEYSSERVCVSYICREYIDESGSSYCIFYNTTELTMYLNPCDEAFQCPELEEESNNSICTAPTHSGPDSFPGEQCSSNINCVTFNCTDNLCHGTQSGESCESHQDCDIGLYCDSNVCKEIKKNGDPCNSDYECSSDSFCYEETKVCTPYFSLESGTLLSSCYDDLVDWRCVSGFCYKEVNAQGEIVYQCKDAVKSIQSKPIRCNSNENLCVGRDGYTKSQCECGYNSDGDAYCHLLPADSDYASLIRMYKRWFTSGEVANCNTVARGSLNCMTTHWKAEEYIQLRYYYLKTKYWPLIHNNEDCVKEIKTSEYWYAEDKYSDEFDDAAEILKISALVLLIVFS